MTYVVIFCSIVYSIARGDDVPFNDVALSIDTNYSLREADTIVQYGDARSGSTFQWYVLCTIMRMLAINAGKEVNCMVSKYYKFPKNIFKIHYPDRGVQWMMSDFDNKFKGKQMRIFYFLSSKNMRINTTQFSGDHTLVYTQYLSLIHI